ncbi:MAG: phosphatidylserine decarboxylase [Deltaproteobacteria bacterium]
MERKRSPIASEGFIYLGILAFLAWASAIFDFTLLSFIFALLTVITLFFFRDPDRKIPDEEDSVVSPADGRVIMIEEVYERDFLGEPMRRVSISLALYDCHINRMPVGGKVIGTKYSPGSFNIANMPEWLFSEGMKRKSEDNERLSTLIETGDGEKLVVTQIAGFLARRLVSYADLEMKFKKGERYGMIKFGSRVDLYLPEDSILEVGQGDRVKAGESVIAWLDGSRE